MDILAFVPNRSTFSTRAHLSEIGVWIPTDMSIFPLYLEGIGMLFEKFRLFREPVHNTGYGTQQEKSTCDFS